MITGSGDSGLSGGNFGSCQFRFTHYDWPRDIRYFQPDKPCLDAGMIHQHTPYRKLEISSPLPIFYLRRLHAASTVLFFVSRHIALHLHFIAARTCTV